MSQIKKLTDYQHLRHRIHMYLGSNDPHTQKMFNIIDGTTSLTDVTWVPALYTAFREILDNASDEVIGHKFGDRIDVTYDPENFIFSVKDNGRGIPFTFDEQHQTYLATMVLSEPRAGRNFEERGNVAGTNGIGAAATSNTAEWFKMKINKDGKQFTQKFHEGIKDATKLIIEQPIIKDTKQENGTFIEYTPSREVYKHLVLPEEFMYSRLYEFAAVNPNTKVYYNGKHIKVKDKVEKTLFPNYKTMVIDINDEEQKFYSKFVLVPNFVNDGDFYYSIVNNICAFNGGTQTEAFRLTFVRNLLNALTKESKKRKLTPNRSDVTEGLLIFNVTNMQAPNFDSQSKTRLTNEEAGSIINKYLSDDEFYTKFIKKNKEWIDEIYQRCEDRTHKKDASEIEKMQKKMARTKIPSLMDATGKDRTQCKLFIAEGNCIEENQEIITIENNKFVNKKMKDLELFDNVITHKGNIKPITNIQKKISKTVTLKTNIGNIVLTDEHKLMVFDTITQEFSFKKVKKLKTTDKLIKNQISDFTKTFEVIKIEEGDFVIDNKNYKFYVTMADINNENMLSQYVTEYHKQAIVNLEENKLQMKDFNNIKVGDLVIGKINEK